MSVEKCLEDLIVMEFTQDHSSIKIIGIEEAIKKYPSLEINASEKTWVWRTSPRSPYQSKPTIEAIGRARHIYRHGREDYGIIGIYNRIKNEHLTNMLRDWEKFVAMRSENSTKPY